MDQTFPAVQNWLTWAYEANGKYREAFESDLKQKTLSGVNGEAIQSLRAAMIPEGGRLIGRKIWSCAPRNLKIRGSLWTSACSIGVLAKLIKFLMC
jgi:predicted NAD-dependent protein-ADP-ribosyltransferase YbiA (DUF1768 family)